MTHDHELESRLWELVYELLPADEAAALRERISSDPRVADVYGRVERDTHLVASAARIDDPRLALPDVGGRATTVSRAGAAHRAPWMNALLSTSVSLLAVLAALTHWQFDSPSGARRIADAHRELADEHVRTVVVSPERWTTGTTNRVSVTTTSADGRHQPARLGYQFTDAAGKVLLRRTAQTDARGHYAMLIPGEFVADDAKLEIWPEGRPGDPLTCRVDVGERRHVTRLTTDKPVYEPGQTVLFRSLTLSRLDFSAAEVPVEFHVLGPDGTEIPTSRKDGVTVHGVGTGAFGVPATAPVGRYTLVAQSSDPQVAGARCHFDVHRYRAPPTRWNKDLEFTRNRYAPGDTVVADYLATTPAGEPLAAADVQVVATMDGRTIFDDRLVTSADGTLQVQFRLPDAIETGNGRLSVTADDDATQETVTRSIPIHLGRVDVAFYPEGGILAPELENRVYFEATDALGKPVDVRGVLVSDSGRHVADVATEHQGRGSFRFVPLAGESYCVRYGQAGTTTTAALPAPDSTAHVIIDTGPGVFPAGAPISMAVRSSRSGTPIVLAAACWGMNVGTASGVTSAAEPVRLELPLSDEARGVVRVTAFDYSSSPPQPLAERLVYRRPQKKLAVKIDDPAAAAGHVPGDRVELGLRVTDERGEPVAAALGVSVVDDAILDLAATPPGIETYYQLLTEIERPEDLEEADFLLADSERSARALDLLLGTRGWRQFVPDPMLAGVLAESAEFRLTSPPAAVLAPSVNDDLAQVSARFLDAFERLLERRRSLRAGSMAALIAASLAILALAGFAASRFQASRSATALAVGSCLIVGVLAGSRLTSAPQWPALAAAPAQFARYSLPPEDRLARLSDSRRGFADGNQTLFTRDHPRLAFGVEEEQESRAARWARMDTRDDYWRRDDLAEIEPLNAWAMPLVEHFALAPPQFPIRSYAYHRQLKRNIGRRESAETLYWNPLLLADSQGRASFQFDLPDTITEFRVLAEGHAAGRLGTGRHSVDSKSPLSLAVQLPRQVTMGDVIELPLVVNNNSLQPIEFLYKVQLGSNLALDDATDQVRTVAPRQNYRFFQTVRALGIAERNAIRFSASGPAFHEELYGNVGIQPAGYPAERSYAGCLDGEQELVVDLPPDVIPASVEGLFAAFPSPLADLAQAIDGLRNEPGADFEQMSTANYAGIISLEYMHEHQVAQPELMRKAQSVLADGSAHLLGFLDAHSEFDAFGLDPGHEVLTAHALMEYFDRQSVWGGDENVLQRSYRRLMERRDGEGGFRHSEVAGGGHRRVPKEIADAYIVWALTQAGQTGIDAELDATIRHAQASDDPYLVALAAGAALDVEPRREAGVRMAERLAALQHADGHLAATQGTITQSGGVSLKVETTALAAMAWSKEGRHAAETERAIDWIVGHRQASGTFGSPQATVLALKALVASAGRHTPAAQPGALVVMKDDREIGRVELGVAQTAPVRLPGLEAHLEPGTNRLRLRSTLDQPLPFVLGVSYRSPRPDNHPDCTVRLSTRLAASSVDAGRTVPLEVAVENTQPRGLPMTTAVIGLPAGLRAREEQLDELRQAGHYDKHEERAGELVFYWRSLAPAAPGVPGPSFTLDLVAEIPGRFTGPPSRAYLHHTAEQKHWTEPLVIEIRK